MTKTVLKVKYGNELRRVLLEENEHSLDAIKKLTQTLFIKLQNQSIEFKYKDDEGDIVTVSSDREFAEALRLSNETKILRLEVKTKGIENDSQTEVPVHNAYCDACDNSRRIRGTRYKCTTCPDYDLCKKCFDKEFHHPGSVHNTTHHYESITQPCYWRRGCHREFNGVPRQTEKQENKTSIPNVAEVKKEEPKTPQIEIKKEIPKVEPKIVEPKIETIPTPNVETPKQEVKKEASVFETKLKQLEDMGFVNRQRNVALLVKHKGIVELVVRELLF